MAFRKIFKRARAIFFLAPFAAFLGFTIVPASAQPLSLIRDTEIERVLKGYEDPILKVAGLDPAAVKIYIVNDPSINAFVAEGQNIFINTGLILELKTPNQVIGVMAHETGHMAGGHLIRDTSAISKASIPMLIGMAVGIAAMALGGGDAGMAAIMMGQQAAQAQFLAFSRVQEATADQMGQRFLRATHQSGAGMLEVFQKFADEEAMSAAFKQPFVSDHPASRERIDLLQQLVDASPYKDVKDSPESVHEFHMIQAKLAGYLSDPDAVLTHYPVTDQSQEARYARVMAYFRKPDLDKALVEANSLVKEEPKNPYFWEVLGQIYVEMSQPQKGIGPYQKSVDLLPDAPLLRVSLAAAQLATEKPALAKPALENLTVSLQQENDNTFAWYESAQAYSLLGNTAMADLSTAERYYSAGAMPIAAQFAKRAETQLTKGSPDWERANDILIAVPQAVKAQQQ
ncbi:MAG TPA: M48 family metalloprotease [Rhizomicrobium sp.]|nr:M48 family metalloprotease [Rhizomicrobium sp.]